MRRRMRVIAILDGAEPAGLVPLSAVHLHTIAYFADALAPVWDLRIVDAQLLKRKGSPMSPLLQADVDHLVGRGIVEASEVHHEKDEDGDWRLSANYALNRVLAGPILEEIQRHPETDSELRFVRELVLAFSAIGPSGLGSVAKSDASYGDIMVDVGGMVDIATDSSERNLSARVAFRFKDLMDREVALSPAEMTHYYVRELQKRIFADG